MVTVEARSKLHIADLDAAVTAKLTADLSDEATLGLRHYFTDSTGSSKYICFHTKSQSRAKIQTIDATQNGTRSRWARPYWPSSRGSPAASSWGRSYADQPGPILRGATLPWASSKFTTCDGTIHSCGTLCTGLFRSADRCAPSSVRRTSLWSRLFSSVERPGKRRWPRARRHLFMTMPSNGQKMNVASNTVVRSPQTLYRTSTPFFPGHAVGLECQVADRPCHLYSSCPATCSQRRGGSYDDGPATTGPHAAHLVRNTLTPSLRRISFGYESGADIGIDTLNIWVRCEKK